jgi:hypothetical protein
MRIIYTIILVLLITIGATQSNAQNNEQINMQALHEFVNTNHINVHDKGTFFWEPLTDIVLNSSDEKIYFKIAPKSESLHDARVLTFASLLKLNSDISNVVIDQDFYSVSFLVKGEPAGETVIFHTEIPN